ncbi:MAG: 50S ribosomal protein L13 [Deltaproteobacteria bacterium]|nr:MAG: 50S ribosomal protein L13 [Deltaproteobacteria bacterium]
MKTYMPKEVERKWHVIDLEGAVLGRAASQIATLLRGKHKATFAPHLDTGDFVVVVNASKIRVTGRKLDNKIYYRHSGYMGGLKAISLRRLLEKDPERVIREAVRRMLPKNRIGRKQLSKLKIYAGSEHPHKAQKPVPLALSK